jgi:DNA-binding winged helix-turn-helix (wHTH) protein/Tfp pilus assembly protein PilF
MLTVPRVLYEFGSFRVDPAKQQLLHDGQPVSITPKALETLIVLLRHAGEDVTREQLIEELWPDSFVEEANLSQNIFMLRKALGDTPEDRRYIVTLPGRGYRFAGKVNTIPAEGETDLAAVTGQPARDVPLAEDSRSTKRNLGIWVYMLAIGAAAAAGLIISFFIGRPKAIALSEQDSVLVSEFTNKTGDAVFDDTLRQGMAVLLAQSPMLTLVSQDRIEQTLALMGRPAGTRLTPELARQVCERTGSAVLLEGSISTLGTRYVVGMVARNCRSGEVLAEEQEQVTKKEDVLNAVTQIAKRFRARIGESKSLIERHDTPLAQATTPSLDALKAYSLGWQVHEESGPAAAIPFFQRAVEIDPGFAAAHAALGLLHGTTGESALASQSIRRAYELRNHASDQERFFIDAYYDGRATGNEEKAERTCEEWERIYPRDITPHSFLAGFIFTGLGQYEKAAQEAQQVIRLDPGNAIGYAILAGNQVYLNRMDAAEKTLRSASDRGIDLPEYLILRYDIAFLKGDAAEMEHVAQFAGENSGAQDWVADHQAFAFAYHGRRKEALDMARRAASLAEQAGHRERAALFETPPALWEAFFGNAVEAKRRATAALAQTEDREVKYGAALALALSGDSARSGALANDLEKEFPDDTSVRFSYLPTVRAVLALTRHEPAKAIDLLKPAELYELGTPRSKLQGFFGELYPVYVRGLAYLAAHDGARAAGEFQKILDHPGIVGSDMIGALAQLQQARAFALSGDPAKARTAYGAYLATWKDADSDLLVLRQARAELSRLKQGAGSY